MSKGGFHWPEGVAFILSNAEILLIPGKFRSVLFSVTELEF